MVDYDPNGLINQLKRFQRWSNYHEDDDDNYASHCKDQEIIDTDHYLII